MWNPIRYLKKWNLDRKQRALNKEYEKEGYSDEILEKQVALNEKKAELNYKEKEYLQ